MSSVSKGKIFEKSCIGFLNSLFDEVEWLSENKKSVFDFRCIKNNKEYFVEAKYNKDNIKPVLRKSQEEADFVVTNNGKKFVLISRSDFDEEIKISKEDATLIKVKPETYERLEKKRGFNGCIYLNDVIKYLLDQEEKNK